MSNYCLLIGVREGIGVGSCGCGGGIVGGFGIGWRQETKKTCIYNTVRHGDGMPGSEEISKIWMWLDNIILESISEDLCKLRTNYCKSAVRISKYDS